MVIIVFLVSASFYCMQEKPFENNEKSAGVESAYKPMLKLDDVIYGFDGDVDKIDVSELENLGEIKYSHHSITVPVQETDENFTSNVFDEGLAIYRVNDAEVIVVGRDFISKLKKLPQ